MAEKKIIAVVGATGHTSAMARAARDAGASHVIWSTLEDTRIRVPLSDARLPTLKGQYKVPHFDAKGEADHVFARSLDPDLSRSLAGWSGTRRRSRRASST